MTIWPSVLTSIVFVFSRFSVAAVFVGDGDLEGGFRFFLVRVSDFVGERCVFSSAKCFRQWLVRLCFKFSLLLHHRISQLAHTARLALYRLFVYGSPFSSMFCALATSNCFCSVFVIIY